MILIQFLENKKSQTFTWVENILQEDQVTSAPSSTKVSIRTAVWMVMWRQPAMRAPLSGFVTPNSLDKVNLWLRLIVTHLSQGHQTRHFILSNRNLFAAPFPQINISYLEVFWHSKKLLSLFLCLANTWLINVCGDMKDFTTFFGRQNPENQPTSGRLRNRVPPLAYTLLTNYISWLAWGC